MKNAKPSTWISTADYADFADKNPEGNPLNLRNLRLKS
jgi:hypothetical protein